jgi:hypothetical protein
MTGKNAYSLNNLQDTEPEGKVGKADESHNFHLKSRLLKATF